MLAHRSGVIGLPLRLLAREVYDRIVALRGPSEVALVTGEERIVPDRARYWVCTVEAMVEGENPEFLAVDEIQLAADPERGHVFTQRLLHARGSRETLFLGAQTMRRAILALIPEVEFLDRARYSDLTYTGSKKTSRMPERSAIVGFSVENLYALAELMRRQKGGVAVVMGALSPRTRNAQVELYQNGDVDYLVATDAIGMGLNLDIDHVAFSALSKFDGRRMRALFPHEMGQIAGRAGRFRNDGTFGVTGEAPALDPALAEAIVEHRFAPVKKLHWRNPELDFTSLERLIASLERPTDDPWLTRARDADDLIALKALSGDAEVAARATSPAALRLLWDICRIPDFRAISHGEHARLLTTLYCDLHEHGRVGADWFATQVNRVDKPQGGIDALSKRLAYIRTWTYVAQRKSWLDDVDHWRGATRAVEDRLSDALHLALTQRFVDRRTSVLMRRLKQKESLVATVNDKGEVEVEGAYIGKLEGFRFHGDSSSGAEEAKALNAAAVQALAPEFHLRADRFYNAPDTEIDFTEQGGLMWGEHAVGKLVRGADILKPEVRAFVDDVAGPDVAAKVARRLQHFIDRKVATLFEPLLAMGRDETLTGLTRGFAFRLTEALGILPRAQVAEDVKALDQEMRGALRKHGVRFGQFTIFMPLLLKPAPTRLRLVLAGLWNGADEFPEAPPPGLVTVPAPEHVTDETWRLAGYRRAGSRAIRIDMLERLADMLRGQDSRGGFEATPDMLSITGLTLEQFADLMGGLGYKAERGERDKLRAAPAEKPEASSDAKADEKADEKAGEKPEEPAETRPDGEGADTAAQVSEAPAAAAEEAAPAEDAPEREVFYTFTWGGFGARSRGKGARRGGAEAAGATKDARPQRGQRKGQRKSGKPGGRSDGGGKPRAYQARPPKKEQKIDPDNPFAAALMGLKDKS
ncbi:MAG TPA: disulfide oxidoreductase [Aliiroseovarius sp.]|nr:disulfide oxidoreductase [Aliiroseovarius sp.]